MFSWRRKLREPFGKHTAPEETEAAGTAEDALITRVVSLEEMNNMASGPGEAPEKAPEEIEDTLAQPDAEPAAEEKGVTGVPESAGDGESEPEGEDEGDSFSNLFSQEEEEENPLAGLITSLTDVAAGELIEEAQEVKTLLGKWQKS